MCSLLPFHPHEAAAQSGYVEVQSGARIWTQAIWLYFPNDCGTNGRGKVEPSPPGTQADLFPFLSGKLSPPPLCGMLGRCRHALGMCLFFSSQVQSYICFLVGIRIGNWNNWKRKLKIRNQKGSGKAQYIILYKDTIEKNVTWVMLLQLLSVFTRVFSQDTPHCYPLLSSPLYRSGWWGPEKSEVSTLVHVGLESRLSVSFPSPPVLLPYAPPLFHLSSYSRSKRKCCMYLKHRPRDFISFLHALIFFGCITHCCKFSS